MQTRRVTSLDKSYRHGDLSVFPAAIDSIATLHQASNKAVTTLKHSLTSTAKYIIVNDASKFPPIGILKLSTSDNSEFEVVYYSLKVGNQFHRLQRHTGGAIQTVWPAGAIVKAPVMAEHHNALKDAIIKVQKRIGLIDGTDPNTVSGMVASLERKWNTPKAAFRAMPLNGTPPLTTHFHSFTHMQNIRYLWNFGDGTTSTEQHPDHTYHDEGLYTVTLNIVSESNAQAMTEKVGYIKVSNDQNFPFFYVSPDIGEAKTTFSFIDQTDGGIVERHWFFGDGNSKTESDPNFHTIDYKYDKPGQYNPSLIIKFSDNRVVKTTLDKGIIVT